MKKLLFVFMFVMISVFTSKVYALETNDDQEVIVNKKEDSISASNISKGYNGNFKLEVSCSSNNSLYYKVEDSSILSIDSNGYVTIHKLGNTNVIIYTKESEEYKGCSKTININIYSSLTTPVINDCYVDNDHVVLKWNKVENASGYKIYRKINSNDYRYLTSVSGLEYKDKNINIGNSYEYKIEAYNDLEFAFSNSKQVICLNSPSLTTSNESSYIKLKWTKIDNCNGYYIYRNNELIKTITNNNTLGYKDTDVVNGKYYTYSIQTYKDDSKYSLNKSGIYRLTKTNITIVKSNTTVKASWDANDEANKYILQYSTSKIFNGVNTLYLDNSNVTINNINSNKTYYVRVRSYKNYNNKNYYSCWAYSTNEATINKVTTSYIKVNNKKIELKKASKQSLYGYDTVQGNCSDGTYGYYAMYNRKVEKCKIIKVRLSDYKVIKVSGVLNIHHGNGLTYNKDTNKIVAVHTRINTKRISIIDANTLTIDKDLDINIFGGIYGTSNSLIKGSTGYSGVAYNENKKEYVLLTKGNHNFVIMNKDFEVIEYIEINNKQFQLIQSIDCNDDYILVCSSPQSKKPYNIISVYDWEGNFISKINVIKGYELEGIFHVGNQFYGATYSSGYETYWTYKKVKKKCKPYYKKVKKKCKPYYKKVKVKCKPYYKKVKGKKVRYTYKYVKKKYTYKYVKKKYTYKYVKKKYTYKYVKVKNKKKKRLVRNNYIYKITM